MAGERILVVEDEGELRRLICAYLGSEGYLPLEAGDGAEALSRWREEHPDLIILDWMLPKRSGLDVAREIRTGHAPTPIIMLTARNEEADVVLGLELGADDYLVKPVSLRQLVARIRAVLRRTGPQAAQGEPIQLGELALDPVAHVARVSGQELALTATEFKLLLALAQSPNRVFTRMQLMEASTGDYFEGYERTIDSHISHLRHKLQAADLIHTVHGIGYKLVPPGR
jgi:DNA-binding response OmpR family regulator